MYNLIRFYNQNRRKILVVILAIAFILFLIQLANYFTKISKNKTYENISTENNEVNTTIQMSSEESAVTGSDISTSQKETAKTFVTKFITACNNQNLDEAYNMLTDECREEMYPTQNDFKVSYYDYIFNGTYKKYSMENWVNDTYKIEFSEDIMATGNTNSAKIQDYITLKKVDSDYKLNINSYIGRTNVNKTTETKNIKVTVLSKNTYMETEKYNIQVENLSGKSVLLDTKTSTKSVYLQDSKNAKYYANMINVLDNQLVINNQFKINYNIEFYSTYSSTKNIKNIVFSDFVLDYDEYKNLENKNEYDNYTIMANI